MKRKNRDEVAARPNSPVGKKRKLEYQHESTDNQGSNPAPRIDSPEELWRGKRTRLATKRATAVRPIRQEMEPTGPIGQEELPVEPSIEQAVDDADLQQMIQASLLEEQIICSLIDTFPPGSNTLLGAGNETLPPMSPNLQDGDVLEEQILDLLSDAPPGSSTLLGAGNESIRPMPPMFQDVLNQLQDSGLMSEGTHQYYLNLGRGDSLKVPGEGGRKSLLEDVLRQDAQETEGKKGSGWKPGKKLGQGSFGVVILWEKARPDGPPLRIATKDATQIDLFFADYNSEGNLVRRLNDVGCKNVIKVLDWYIVKGRFRTCFEYAEFGNLWKLDIWYRQRNLVFPEAFIWHVFYSIASALCYCRYGTNILHSGTGRPQWEQIIHGDLKPDNVLFAAPDEACHRLYPCLKVADFGHSYTLGEPRAEIQRFKSLSRTGPDAWAGPEINWKVAEDRLPRPGDFQDSYSDVYSLGLIMVEICKHANTFVAEPIRDLLEGSKRSTNPSGRRIFSTYYSKQLRELIRKCRSRDPLERPPIYDLYRETKSWMEAFREHAYREVEDTPDNVIAGIAIHHSKVLYTSEEQKVFEENMEFREKFESANSDPVFEAEDLDAFGDAGAKRKYEKLLGTIDESIITAIPEMPESGDSLVDSSDSLSENSDDLVPNSPSTSGAATYGGSSSSPGNQRIRSAMKVNNLLNG